MIALPGTPLSVLLANTPPPEFDPNTVTPGPEGFIAIFLIAAAVVLLGFDMVRRIRRTTYRAQIKERLEAEIAAKEAAGDEGPDSATDPAGEGERPTG